MRRVVETTIITLLIGIFFPNLSIAQQSSEGNDLSITKTIPASPEAASLGKYGEIPVNNYTGIPSISIPIHEVTSGDLSLPISLSYHAGGIKVEEVASWVGLGWSLNAGGVITRTIRGIADERDQLTPYGHYREVFDFIQSDVEETAKHDVYRNIESGLVDLESDIYYFNFGGYSGKFYMDADPTDPSRLIPVLKPKGAFRITYDENSNDEIYRWTITTPDGAKYVFGRSIDSTRDGIEKNESYSVCYKDIGAFEPGYSDELASSWFLIEVISPKGFRIDLFYEDNNYRFRTFGNETSQLLVPGTDQYGGTPCGDRFNKCYVRNYMKGKRLTSIVYLNGAIDFDTSDKFRADFCQNKSLESITIYGEDQVEYLKKFNLIHGYFHPSNVQEPEDLDTHCGDVNSDNGAEYRLKLEELYEEDYIGNTKPAHIFNYNESIYLPPRLPFDGINSYTTAFAQDHWGYYNGQHNNQRVSGYSTLIPTFYETYIGDGNDEVYYFSGANRTANSYYAKANTLTSITYPTGGSTSFTYEGNSISSDQIPIGYTLAQNARLAGPFDYSSDDQNDPPQDYTPFTINSDLDRNGVLGADVQTLFYERATQPGECGGAGSVLNEGEWIVNRYIYDANTGTEVYSNDSQDGETIFLPNGDYYVRLARKNDIGTDCHSNFSMTLKWVELDDGRGPVSNVEVGGLRVKEIRSSDGISPDNDLVTTYDYKRLDGSNLSSGAAVTFPLYGWKFYKEDHVYETDGTGSGGSGVGNDPLHQIVFTCPFFVRQSYSFYPLATTQGGLVGYENVTQYSGGTSAAGKTEFTYTSAREFPDDQVFLAPANSYDWRRGLLKKTTMYKEESGVYATVQESEYDYTKENLESSSGMKVTVTHRFMSPDLGTYTSQWLLSEYETSTEWQYKSEQISRSNFSDDGSDWLEILEEYQYSSSHFQMTEASKSQSDGSTLITRVSYPQDIHEITAIPNVPSDAEGKALRAMLDQFILVSPIETQTIRKEGAQEYLLQGKINTYQELNGVVSPYEEYFLETAIPITGAQRASYITNTGLDFEAEYKPRVKYSVINDQGQVLEYTATDGISTVLLWGYNGEYPVAKITNTTIAQVEAAGVSKSTRTGALSEIDRRTIMDIESARISTYEYEPGIGVTVIRDENGIASHFYYDDFNRLERILDHEGNIIKQFEYNYAND